MDELFCEVDDFCQVFIPDWQRRQLSSGERQRQRDCRLTASEMMTIIIHFPQSQYRHFKAYYLRYVCKHLKAAFPSRVRRRIGGLE